MRWIVDVGYPLNQYDEIQPELDTLAAFYSVKSESAGFGFGMRDVQYTVTSLHKARVLTYTIRVVIGAITPQPGRTNRERTECVADNIPYVDYYWEPSSPYVFLLRHGEFRDFWWEITEGRKGLPSQRVSLDTKIHSWLAIHGRKTR